VQIFVLRNFAHFLRNQRKTGSIAQNVHFYAKHGIDQIDQN